MIIDNHTGVVVLPKYDRGLLDVNGVYQLILQNRYTEKIYLYTVRDMTPVNRNRYHFDVMLELVAGEYTYYLVSYDAWREEYINRHYVPRSTRMLDATVMATGDVLMKVGDRLMVLAQVDASGPTGTSEGRFEAGMVVEMRVLNTGVVRVIDN